MAKTLLGAAQPWHQGVICPNHRRAFFLVFFLNTPNSDRTTLRDWGVGSGDTLTIQVPAQLTPYIRVKLGPEYVDFANSKLDGQDTMIFIADPSTETLDDLMRKVIARLDPTGRLTLGMTREGVKIRKHGSGWMFGKVPWSRESTLASIGIQSGDCAFTIVVIHLQSRDFPY